MIYLNTYHYVKDRSRYRNNIEDLFATTVLSGKMDDRDKELISTIDKSTYLNNRAIISFNGDVTPIRDLSRGLKTLLVIRWFIKNNKPDIAFDITSCGDNVLNEIARESKIKDLHLLTRNYVTATAMEQAKILVNGKTLIDSFSDLVTAGDILYEASN